MRIRFLRVSDESGWRVFKWKDLSLLPFSRLLPLRPLRAIQECFNRSCMMLDGGWQSEIRQQRLVIIARATPKVERDADMVNVVFIGEPVAGQRASCRVRKNVRFREYPR